MSEKQSLPNQTSSVAPSPRKGMRKSERLKRKKRITLIVSTLCVLVVSLYFFLLYHPSTSFMDVSVSDSVLSNKVKRITREKLETKYDGILPFDSVLTPSLSKLEAGLKRDIPEIRTVEVSRSVFKKSVMVTYTLREPVFQMADGRYIDHDLVRYADERAPKLPVVQFINGISAKDLTKLIFLKDNIESALFTVETVDINAQNDVVFTLSTPHKTQVLFSLKQDEKDVWSKIVSALDIEPLKSDKETFKDVQSIDARFGNKIYYKMYLDHDTTVPTSTATTTYTRE